MDLREKPGKIQYLLELSLRFRLIFVVLLVVLSVMFLSTNWNGMASLPLGASEALGMWLAGMDNPSGLWAQAQYLGVSAVAACVLFFVFGGIRAGIGGLVSLLLFVSSLFLLGGSEGMQLIFFAVFAAVALVLLLVAKWSVACVLFPLALSWIFLTGFVAWFPLSSVTSWLLWAVFSALGFSNVVAFALVAGKELGSGTPQAGAIVKAGKKMMVPVLVSSLLALCALTLDMGSVSLKGIVSALILWIAFFVWFFGFTFGTMAFAPWERLRSSSRRVEIKDRKKKK